MFSDGVLPLVKSGAINGSMKTREAGKLVATFLIGTQVSHMVHFTIYAPQYVASFKRQL